MKIQYLKPAPNATTGDIKDINTAQAKILIQLGFAKEYDENDSDDGNTGDLFRQLDESQEPQETTDPVADNQESPETDESGKATETVGNGEQVQIAETNEVPKPKKSKPKKTDTEK